MKQEHSAWRPLRHEEIYQLRNEDSYKQTGKLSVARCPKCGATHRAGRWSWEGAASDAEPYVCPACLRIQDDQPGGEVLIHGEFAQTHYADLERLIRNTEAIEKAEHPLERLMNLGHLEGGLLVSTTGMHLARRIGEALYAAYKGEVRYYYREADSRLHVVWTR